MAIGGTNYVYLYHRCLSSAIVSSYRRLFEDVLDGWRRLPQMAPDNDNEADDKIIMAAMQWILVCGKGVCRPEAMIIILSTTRENV